MANDTSLQSQINSTLELYSNGQIREALNASESLTIKYPDESLLFNISGVCYKAIGQLQDAIKSLEKAIAIKPDFTDAYYNLGLTFQELNMLEAAVKSYEKAIEIEPKYAIVHNNLGIVFRELGQINDSINCYKKAIASQPDFIEAFNNLGNVLKESDRLDDAVTCYEKAIVLDPNFVDAYNNLGIVLFEMGQFDDAIKLYERALEIEPSYAEVHNNLGNVLKNIGQLDEAAKSYKLSLELEPDFAEVHNNLGITLKEMGRLEEAEKFYRKAIELQPEYIEAMLNLSNLLDYMNNLDEAILILENILKMDKGIYRLKSAVNLAIFRFLEDDFGASKKHLSEIKKTLDLESNTYLIYWKYLLKILSSYENKPSDNLDFITRKKLYVIGESHSLVSHGLHVKILNDDFICKSLLIKGCMQWHLGNSIRNQYKNKFEGLFHSLPKSSDVLLSIGEIDCRLNGGLIKYRNKYPEKNITQLIYTTVENYLNYIYKINSSCGHKVIIQGVPCSNIDTKNIPKEKVIELVNLIREFNMVLKDKSIEIGFGFLDVYKLTDRGDGISNQSWNIDEYHLSPEGVQEAWREYFFS